MAAEGIPVSKGKIMSLYRSFLRTSRQFKDYDIWEYAKHRTIDAFCSNRHLDDERLSVAFFHGVSQLEVAYHRAVVYFLYAPKTKSVMELHSPLS